MKYIVTHSRAPNSDPRRVEAALETWAEALAKAVMQEALEEQPIVRIVLKPGRPGRTRRKSSRQ